MITLSTTLLSALILDAVLGEPKKFHPLVGFGNWANTLEQYLRLPTQAPIFIQKLTGLLAVLLAVVPITLLIAIINHQFQTTFIIDSVLLYLCIAPRSLIEHTQAVYQCLKKSDLNASRSAIARIVSRETQHMSPLAICKATLETTLENGADAIFAPIFWFIIAGAEGVVFYRLSNTLDAMWGYKNSRYLYFGYAAAKLDDVLNFIPARLTALSYLLLGHSHHAWHCYRQQSPHCESPNAGVVMATGAGSLNIKLGGNAIYHGQLTSKPLLGCGNTAHIHDISRANVLIILTIMLWLAMIFLGETLA